MPADILSAGVIEEKGFSITSSAEVNVFFLNQSDYSADMLHLIDSAKLGTTYVVAGYHNIRNDQISVQATQDNTTVTLSPKGGSPLSLRLNVGQTYLYSQDTDLTGSLVSADKPIAVQSGNYCAKVPTDYYYACDLLDEQIPSIDTLSTSYLVPAASNGIARTTGGNIVRVVATADNTEVEVNGVTVAILNKGDYYQGSVGIRDYGAQINATHPVLVVEYLVGTPADEEPNFHSDPAMTVIPGTDHWISSYAFYMPPRNDSVALNFSNKLAEVVIETSAQASLRVAGNAVDPAAFHPIGATGYSAAIITGGSPVTADKAFELLWQGNSVASSYFTYAGSSYGHGTLLSAPQTPPPTQVPPNAAGNDPSADANILYFVRAAAGAARLSLFGPSLASGSVNGAGGFNMPFQLDADGYAAIDLPTDGGLNFDETENKGWWVSSAGVLTGYLRPGELTSIIKGSGLGTNYVIASYHNNGPLSSSHDAGPGDDQIAVLATRNNTTVTIMPKGTKGFRRLTLNAGQTFFYQALKEFQEIGIDLTGAFVTADKPILVQASNPCASIDGPCGQLVEQIPPLEVLSTHYLLPQTPNAVGDLNVLRVVATADATEVMLNGIKVATLNQGEHFEGRVKGGVEIIADHPVLVAEYLPASYPSQSLPAMAIVPGVDRWQKRYVFSSSIFSPSTADSRSDYVSVVIGTASLPSLRVAGKEVNPGEFSPIGTTGYSYGSVDISSNVGALSAEADTAFGLLLSTSNGDFTYGMSDINGDESPPPTPASPPPVAAYPPHCNDDSARVIAGGSAKLAVLSNDSDPDGGALTVVSVTTPTEHGGTVSINGDGSLTYLPPNGYTGSDGFSYTAKNAKGATATAQVEISVTTADEPTPNKPPATGTDGSAASPAAVSSRGGGGILDLDCLMWLLVMSYWRGRLNQALESLGNRPLP